MALPEQRGGVMRIVRVSAVLIVIAAVLSVAVYKGAGVYEIYRREQWVARQIKEAGGRVEFREFTVAVAARKIRLKFFDRISGLSARGLTLPLDLRTDIALLEKLTKLDLSKTNVDDSDVERLAVLTDLIRLELGNTKIGDQGVKSLVGMRELTYLDLSHTRVTDDGVQSLRELRNLEVLDLSSTALTDVGVKYLGRMWSLQRLLLCNTPITDESATELTGLDALSWLDLSNTKTTDAGRAKIGSALRNCSILPVHGR